MRTSDLSAMVTTIEGIPGTNSIALGGSRARGQHKPDSDYDIFVIVDDDAFPQYLRTFAADVKKSNLELIFFAKDKYLEGWGYMFCGLDKYANFFDVAVISRSRSVEMQIRYDNRVLYDKAGFFQGEIRKAKLNRAKTPESHVCDNNSEIVGMFCINLYRYIKASKKNDYWMAFRFLNLMRENLSKYKRKSLSAPSKLDFLPDENYEAETGDSELRRNFAIDGTLKTMDRSAQHIIGEIRILAPNSESIHQMCAVLSYPLKS
jgi:predicted nucleotidyltransferase